MDPSTVLEYGGKFIKTHFNLTLLPVNVFGYWWTVSPFTGSLLRHSAKPLVADEVSAKVRSALLYCDNPFKLQSDFERRKKTSVTEKASYSSLIRVSRIFSKMPFFLQLLYFRMPNYIFDTSESAMAALNASASELRYEHCLQKALLVAKTSKSFEENGVLFIGARLPTAEMHAWIIERDFQPDFTDRVWMNYRPLLAITRV